MEPGGGVGIRARLRACDFPPGTADLQQRLLELLPVAGVLLVVTPQDVAHLDARRLLHMLAEKGTRVLGAVENMAGLRCSHCGETTDVFPTVAPERSIWAHSVERLAALPLDPDLPRQGEAGRPAMLSAPDSEVATRIRELATTLARTVAGDP